MHGFGLYMRDSGYQAYIAEIKTELPMKNPELPYYVTQFFQSYLTGVKNASHHTIASYAATFKLLFIFCEEVREIKTEKLKLIHMEDGLVLEFLDWLEVKRGTSITTRNQRLVAIHSFFRYVQKKSPEHMEAIGRILEIPYKKAPKTVVSYLTEEEMRILLAQPSGENWGSFRHSKSMHMLHAGINLIYIRDFLGHVDSSTTEIYARADTEMKRQAIEASCEDIFPEENLQDWNERTDLMSFLESLY